MFRHSRGEERGWDGRKRGSRSPQKEMDANEVRREARARGGAKDTSGDGNVGDQERTGHVHGEQFEGRRRTGREMDWNNESRGRDGHGRAPKPDDGNEAADRQRLLESLIDPQDVPRSGYYFEVRFEGQWMFI